MQTFLPSMSFLESAKLLDRKRLGKQRIEAFQILETLCRVKSGWKNHPAVKMWSGYEDALVWYYYEVCREWVSRGYKNTMPILIPLPPEQIRMPAWLTIEFCESHQSNLLRKDKEFYSLYFGQFVPDNLPYIWPTS